MSYCEEFQLLIEKEDFSNFLRLWEEYCLGDQIDGEEVIKILRHIKGSTFASHFGKYAETIFPLWKGVNDDKLKGEVLALAVDLQTTNNSIFATLATDHLKKKYGHLKDYNEMLRIVGLRGRLDFQGAISHFELLIHLKKGNFVFHTGGWGVGEIMDASLLREHALIEFEGINTPKDLSFDNAFKSLTPLSSEHFLARRFGNPDSLEKEGKDNPLSLIYLLLRDLGPKTSLEIKDELCDLVIPEIEWSKWWQLARAKIKKDTKIAQPKKGKDPFILRDQALSHDTEFHKVLQETKTTKALISNVYNFLRDFPSVFKKKEIKEEVKSLLQEALEKEQADIATVIQIHFLLEEIFKGEHTSSVTSLIVKLDNPEQILEKIEITFLKKRFLTVIRENREDYYQIFSHLFFLVSQNLLRDYIFKELLTKPDLVKEKLQDLLNKVTIYPEAFFWYFQKIVAENELPFATTLGKQQFLEAFFILFHYIEDKETFRDLVKKMHNFLSQKRYLIFREIIQDASLEYLKEILLVASKVHAFDKEELRTLRSLAEVVQPELKNEKKEVEKKEEIIWTTQEGYNKVKERLHVIATVETIDNAKEIEAARALGDLRENSEYKFALERRSRLQGELKRLSSQLNKARVLTKEDITVNEVGVGTCVSIQDPKKEKLVYTLLGPWDADPDKNILSYQSKFAEAMIGCRVQESFTFQGEQYKVVSIKSFL